MYNCFVWFLLLFATCIKNVIIYIPINAELPILNHIVKEMLVKQICKVILYGQADFVNEIIHFNGFGQLQ